MDSARITDPARIRALAHPLRLELLDLLGERGELTATQCAQAVGESVASCSFHLRMLEKYGFIERAVQRGREKPWRRIASSTGFDARPDAQVPGSMPAVQELASLTVAREADRIAGWIAAAGEEPERWVQATTLTTSSFWATAEEMAELSAAVQRLTDRFAGRAEDPSARPEGARHGRLFAAVHPDAEPAPGTSAKDR